MRRNSNGVAPIGLGIESLVGVNYVGMKQLFYILYALCGLLLLSCGQRKGGALAGVDALYSTVQMPTGIPVATVAIDGGSNAALLAIRILAINDDVLSEKLSEYKQSLADSVAQRDERLQDKIAELEA